MFQFLQKGDKVALISPAAVPNEEAVKIVSKLLSRAGLVPEYQYDMNDPDSGPYTNQYENMPSASSDSIRLRAFQETLNSDAKAIWILHGGQGCEKIVAALERDDLSLSASIKMIIGFSGVTNLHLYFLNKGWPCIHGPVGTISNETLDITECPINSEARLQKVIDTLRGQSETLTYSIIPINETAKKEKNIIKDTTLVGGCLNILITHSGTSTALVGQNKIVFIEDEPQRPERIETLFMGLIRAGTFTGAKAVILGSFSDPELNTERFNIVKPILLDRLANMLAESGLTLPVYHAENFGHGLYNDPLPLDTNARIHPGNPATLKVDVR